MKLSDLLWQQSLLNLARFLNVLFLLADSRAAGVDRLLQLDVLAVKPLPHPFVDLRPDGDRKSDDERNLEAADQPLRKRLVAKQPSKMQQRFRESRTNHGH